MSEVAQLRFRSLALLEQAGEGIRGGLVRLVGTLLLAVVDGGVAAWIGRRWRFQDVVVVARLKAFLSGPSFDQRTVHGEMLAGEQALALGLFENQPEELFGHIAGQQTVAPLPDAITTAILDLGETEYDHLLLELSRTAGSPMSRFHLYRLVCTRLTRQATVIARAIKQHVLSHSFDAEVVVFGEILRWVYSDFAQWEEARSLPSALRLGLAWAHGHSIYSLLRSIGAPLEWQAETFSEIETPFVLRDLLSKHDDANAPLILQPYHWKRFLPTGWPTVPERCFGRVTR